MHYQHDDCPTADERANELWETLDEVLRTFTREGHPGEPCQASGWVRTETVARWREVLARNVQPCALITFAPDLTEAQVAAFKARWEAEVGRG